jgi:hypothetical protein
MWAIVVNRVPLTRRGLGGRPGIGAGQGMRNVKGVTRELVNESCGDVTQGAYGINRIPDKVCFPPWRYDGPSLSRG